MRIQLPQTVRTVGAVALAAGLTACATAGGPDTDLATIRVQNDAISPYVTVSIEPVDGNPRALGTVRQGSAAIFNVPVAETVDRFRLIAVGLGDEDRDDHVVSEVVTLDGSEMITWFIDTNRIENSSD